MTTKRILPLALALCLLASCASLTPQQSALRAAEVSFTTYESVSNAVVAQTKRIMDFRKVRPLTREDRQELAHLDDLRILLDRYSAAHNGYVGALKLGQGVEAARRQVVDLWNQVRDTALTLKLKFTAVAP